MKNVLNNISKVYWEESVPLTYTTNCEVWDEHLVRENGYVYFDDIDYEMQNWARWDALNHVNRIQHKLIAVGKDAALADRQLLDDINAALDYWLDNDFKNPNWWYNQIGIVCSLSAVVIMLYDQLTTERIERCAEIIKRGSVLSALPMVKSIPGKPLM